MNPRTIYPLIIRVLEREVIEIVWRKGREREAAEASKGEMRYSVTVCFGIFFDCVIAWIISPPLDWGGRSVRESFKWGLRATCGGLETHAS